MNIIETFTQVPVIVTLQHTLDAFKALSPAVAILVATFILTKKNQ
jgi:hypothetical protein